VHSQANLFQVVRANRFPRRLARMLNCRQHQGNEHADDGDHDQKFDQRESAAARATNS
jgi:hypothetical protein